MDSVNAINSPHIAHLTAINTRRYDEIIATIGRPHAAELELKAIISARQV